MAESGQEDRRTFERIPVEVPLKFIDLISKKEGSAQTHDISANGIGLVTNEQLPADAPLEIWLNVPKCRNPLYTTGKVIWSAKIDDKYRAGIMLDKPEFVWMSLVLENTHYSI